MSTPLYSAINNSPVTTLAQTIAADATQIELVKIAALPAAPNIVTIGTDESAELVLYTAVSGNRLTGCTRGFNGTTPRAWTAGTKAYRAYTAYDHDTFKKCIEEHQERIGQLSEEIEELKENGTGGSGGMTAAQIAALNNLFKVAAYIKSDVTAEYGAFKEAFGITREWVVVRALRDDEIQGYRGVSETYPYTQYREERAGYYAFDIPVEANVTYKVEFQPNDGAVLCIPRFWNEDALDKASRQENLAGTFTDTEWAASGLTVQAPELVKGSPVACMTLTFKTASEGLIPNGTVSNVVIYKYV